MTTQSITHSGFVALVGRPNTGKSTLLNRLVGQKVAIVSPRPQTTRNRVLGVLTQDHLQMVFLDTPGLHSPKTRLGDFMMRQARDSVRDVDLAVLLVEPESRLPQADLDLLARCDCPVLLAVNKVDTVRRDSLLAVLDSWSKAYPFAALLPISAKTGEGVEALLGEIARHMLEGPAFFPEDAYTDQTERQLVAEFIREQALRVLDQEVPHGIAIEVEQFEQRADGLLDIGAVLYCERPSHKGIIIGKRGDMLRRISTAARLELQRMLGCQVYLHVFVKVREGWRDSEGFIRSVGYDDR